MRVAARDRLPPHLRKAPPGQSPYSCAQLWGRHTGEDAFVIGTGTSLAGFQFGRLAGRLTIALNDALLCPGLDPAYHIFHDHGLWVRYVHVQPHPRTWFVMQKHGREQFLKNDRCLFKARIVEYAHAGSPREVEPTDGLLYTDRTIATAGIQLAWKLGAQRIFLLGVDGYKIRRQDGSESYYWDGRPKGAEKRKERQAGGVVIQDRHDKWIENMRDLRRAFDVRRVYPCKWPGPGVYNLSAKSTIDAWPKVPVEEVLA